jgi:capsular polysaccharide biosynthesis protein
MKFKNMLSGLKSALVTTLIRSGFIHTASANVFFSLCRWTSNSRLNIKVLPLVWMDESTVQKKGLLRRASEGVTYGPHYIGHAQSKERICLPDIYCYVFERARVSVTSSSVILNDAQVVIERAIGPDQDKYDFAGGHVIAHRCDMCVVRLRKTENIKKGIFLGGNGSSNYYHWIVEILAKLEFLSELPEHYQKYPLLVSEDIVRIPSFKESLDVLARGHETIVLNKELQYVVEELIYINSPNNLPFNLFGNQKFKCNYVTIDSLSIDYLRRIALQDALKTPARSSYPKKIFLRRKSGLRNYNQDEVFSYLSAYGFTEIFMEDLSFFEQIRAANYADYIVGPTGAAWTNLIFCRSGTKGLCWMADEFGDFSAYSSIAGMVGVDLRYLTYTAGVYSTKELYSKGYYIDLSMIEKSLSALDETLVSAQ